MIELARGEYLGSIVTSHNCSGLLISLTSYLETGLLNATEVWHVHENPHFSYFLEGGTQEERKNTCFERLPGQIAFYHLSEPHLNKKTKLPSKNINLEIEDFFLKEYNLTTAEISETTGNNQHKGHAMLKMYKEAKKNDQFTTASIHMMFLNMMVRRDKLKPDIARPKWVTMIRELIHDKWDETPTLRELANSTDVHPVTISKYFPKYFYCTLGDYMRQVKIEKAIVLIKNSSHSLLDIAYICGFSDQSHFTRTFKELTGLLPNDYRKL